MSNLAHKNAKYASWMQDYTFDNCKLDRKQYGEFLANYITGERDGFVLNLNGAWGTGKTEFLKRFYTHLQTLKHPVIYIDAWESDFSKDPLTVVASELLNQLEGLNSRIGSDSKMRTLKNYVGRALKSAAIATAGMTSKQLIGDASIGIEGLKSLMDGDQVNYVDELKDHYANQVEAISSIRDKLSILAEVLEQNYDAKLPVIVLVDELDRCRPNYAIEMLEVIKHFFATKNFVFVVGNDTEQLSRSIRAIYGNDFDSHQYLKRFFNRQATLPLPHVSRYLETKDLEHVGIDKMYIFPKYGQSLSNEDSVKQVVSDMAKAYDLKLRDIDQLWAKLKSCLMQIHKTNSESGKQNYINTMALVVGLIEQDKNYAPFKERRIGHNPYETPIDNFSFFEDLKVELAIKIAMDCVIKAPISVEVQYSYSSIEYVLPRHDYFNGYISNNTSANLRNFVRSFQSGVIESERSNTKYWLWEDLKQVIQLSGYIE